jgi:acyl-CoA reductase-like NAD-dependent aldehyde dehydrogenase
MRIVEILQSVLPLNIVQAVPGFGTDVPQVLCSHPLVKKISLTGSTAAGAAAAKTAASHVIPSTLERSYFHLLYFSLSRETFEASFQS